jgi:hypothetical protein
LEVPKSIAHQAPLGAVVIGAILAGPGRRGRSGMMRASRRERRRWKDRR